MSPRGKPLLQARAKQIVSSSGVIILCGRFEGIDQRVIDHFQIEEMSIGDYVLSGGELAAQVILDATVRLIPGVLGNNDSTKDESFSNGLLEYPQYTRPSVWEGQEIPKVLLSGDHTKVANWRKTESEMLTKKIRPDLWRKYKS
jgi:tRNA (guanine37-N1)-methyltransferase